jgi:hypothetical protein
MMRRGLVSSLVVVAAIHKWPWCRSNLRHCRSSLRCYSIAAARRYESPQNCKRQYFVTGFRHVVEVNRKFSLSDSAPSRRILRIQSRYPGRS